MPLKSSMSMRATLTTVCAVRRARGGCRRPAGWYRREFVGGGVDTSPAMVSRSPPKITRPMRWWRSPVGGEHEQGGEDHCAWPFGLVVGVCRLGLASPSRTTTNIPYSVVPVQPGTTLLGLTVKIVRWCVSRVTSWADPCRSGVLPFFRAGGGRTRFAQVADGGSPIRYGVSRKDHCVFSMIVLRARTGF